MDPIPLRVISRPDPGRPGYIRCARPEYGFGDLQPGDMWREPGLDHLGREAWGIVLPNREVWYTTDSAGGMWDVTGDPPAITVSPSINDQGERPWHGWIRAGQIETI